MEFSLSPKAQDYYDRVKRFMDEHITPAEEAYHRELQSLDNKWVVLPIINELKAKAKAEGLNVQLDREAFQADEVYGPVFQQFAQRDVLDLAYDDDAIKIGQRLFLQNCALCHGSDARGQQGFPNLTDNDWLYGGTPDKIKETLLYGRKAAMPGWIDALGEQGVKEMTAYVLSLSGRSVNEREAEAGKA